MPTDHKLNLRFALRRTQFEMGIHRGACPDTLNPTLAIPDSMTSLTHQILQSWGCPQAQIADPPTAMTGMSWPVDRIRIPDL